MSYSGRYFPKNPKKYVGNPDGIYYRSLWERKFMVWCDTNDSVVSWSSEEVIIPYISPVDHKYHRYFPDFLVTLKDSLGNHRKILIEVKPAAQTKPPKKQKRVTKKYLKEVMTWGVNSAKWEAAKEVCLERGWQFQLMTEKELGIYSNK